MKFFTRKSIFGSLDRNRPPTPSPRASSTETKNTKANPTEDKNVKTEDKAAKSPTVNKQAPTGPTNPTPKKSLSIFGSYVPPTNVSPAAKTNAALIAEITDLKAVLKLEQESAAKLTRERDEYRLKVTSGPDVDKQLNNLIERNRVLNLEVEALKKKLLKEKADQLRSKVEIKRENAMLKERNEAVEAQLRRARVYADFMGDALRV